MPDNDSKRRLGLRTGYCKVDCFRLHSGTISFEVSPLGALAVVVELPPSKVNGDEVTLLQKEDCR